MSSEPKKVKNQERIDKVVRLCQGLPFGINVKHKNTGILGHANFLVVFPKYDGDEIYDYDCEIDFFGDGNYLDIDEFEVL